MEFQVIRTEYLSAEEIQSRVPAVANFLTSAGYGKIKVMYGWGCKLPIDELWRYTEIDTPALTALVEQSVRDGIFRFGGGDLYIDDVNETLEFRLCHELDIHFDSGDQNLIERVVALWRAEGLTLYGSPGPIESVQPREWTKLG